MKKMICVFLCALLLCACAAAEISTEGLAGEDKSSAGVSRAGMLRTEETEKSVFDVGSADVVTITDDGLYSVSSGFLDMTLYPPFGWLCLTQDLAQQLDTYTVIYTDPVSAARDMVLSGEHFFLVDAAFTAYVDVYVMKDQLGDIVVNSIDLSEEDEQIVLDWVNVNYFPGADVSAVTLGENRFYCAVSPVYRCYETYIGGYCVDFMIHPVGDELPELSVEDIEFMLMDFSAQPQENLE